MRLQIGKIFSKINDRLILLRHIYPFVKKNERRLISPNNTLCLFCQPRGGSTWLAEILLNISNSVLIDEPLWRGRVVAPFTKSEYFTRKVSQISELNFFYNQYIPENADWPEAKNAFENILAGRAVSIGLYDEQNLRKLKHGSYYITKFNYANLLMPWLIDQFSFSSILLTRHPCAVIASQLKLPSWRDIDPSQAESSEEFPYSDFYFSALERIGTIDSKEKYLASIWALGFKHTAMHPENGKKWLTVSYEGLLNDNQYELKRINERFSLNLLSLDIDHKKPSKSTKNHSLPYLRNNEQLSSWKKELSSKQVNIILNQVALKTQ